VHKRGNQLSSAAAADNTNNGRRHHHESALMAAAHILVCLTKEGKSIDDIAKDFDNNLELVSVWIDYMIGINWMYKDGSDNKWITTDEGKNWIEKYYDIRDS
jgi:predicted transcriptional regulator